MNINILLNERSPPSTYIYGLRAEIQVHASINIKGGEGVAKVGGLIFYMAYREHRCIYICHER